METQTKTLTRAQAKARQRLDDALAALDENRAIYDRQVASGAHGQAFLNMRASSIGLAERKVDRARAAFEKAMGPKAEVRDVVADLTRLLSSAARFDHGFVNHGRTGDDPTVNGTGDAAYALRKAQQSAFAVGTRAFVQIADRPSTRIYIDSRMKRVAAMDPGAFAGDGP